jgi:DNA-binding transcriptional ArsR family regulator
VARSRLSETGVWAAGDDPGEVRVAGSVVVAAVERSSEPRDVQFRTAVETFKLLADDTRIRILWALLHAEHSVGQLADHVGAQPPAVSQHLAKLRAARLVTRRRDGNRIFYATHDEHVQVLIESALLRTEHSARNRATPHSASTYR